MTCCVVGLLIFAGVRWARRLLGSERNDMHAHCAPMATRPVPGGISEASLRPVLAKSPAVGHKASIGLFLYFAAGIGVYLVAVMVLLWTGAAQSVGAPLAWVLRTGCYLGLLLAAVCLSRPRQRLDARKRAGWALIAVGAAIFELGVLDMHLFGVIQIAHGNPLWDIAFHNVGAGLSRHLFAAARGRWTQCDLEPIVEIDPDERATVGVGLRRSANASNPIGASRN